MPGGEPTFDRRLSVTLPFVNRCGPFSSATSVRWRCGKLHRDAYPSSGARGEGEGPVVCLGDAVDDRQAKADTCVVGTHAFVAALKRFDKCGDQLWGELLAGVLDPEHHALGVEAPS